MNNDDLTPTPEDAAAYDELWPAAVIDYTLDVAKETHS